MLKAAAGSGEALPSFVVSNVDWDQSTSDGAKQVKEAFDDYGIKEYIVVEKGNVKIAIMGIFGLDALVCAPTCELAFYDPVEGDPVEGAKKTVAQIQEKEDVDMIVCLSNLRNMQSRHLEILWLMDLLMVWILWMMKIIIRWMSRLFRAVSFEKPMQWEILQLIRYSTRFHLESDRTVLLAIRWSVHT